jgi:hypothetical protein
MLQKYPHPLFPVPLESSRSDASGKARIPRPFLLAQPSHQTRFDSGFNEPEFFFSGSRAALKRRLVKLL